MSKGASASISLSLVSHTNAGKTTLARTLLGRDIGEVRDAPHVTEFADVHTMLETPQHERLLLWDTPGFGDSLRLVRRLRQADNPLGWFLSQVWDRWRDRPFWSSQQALRNVRDEADVMLYLVNAAEAPQAAGYVAPEMDVLAWTGKPVIVLLNQLGPPRSTDEEETESKQWREHLAAHPQVVAVLPLDAFARCWVQEFTLLQAIEAALNGERRALMARLSSAWQAQRFVTFDAAMDALAASLARAAVAQQPVGDTGGERAGVLGRLRQAGSALASGVGMGNSAENGPVARAQRALAEQLDAELRANTAELIALHGLEGRAQGEILARLATHYELRLRVGEGKAAWWGGVLTGALTGLKADIVTGGMTLGGGMLAGGLIGAVGGAGLARFYNLVRGTEQSWLGWNTDALDGLVDAALLRYLAVAHFGRGRGQWERSESPAHWAELVSEVLAPHREALATIWAERGGRLGEAGSADTLAIALKPLLTQSTLSVLRRLYPGSLEVD